jgi:hypothetical protein
MARHKCRLHRFVMAGLVPAIHELAHISPVSVDARHKAGHDDVVKAGRGF